MQAYIQYKDLYHGRTSDCKSYNGLDHLDQTIPGHTIDV